MEQKGCDSVEQRMAHELVDGILAVMRDKLEQIILYGSVARGTNTKDSDVDVALLVKNKLDSDTEDRLSDFIVEMNLKYDRVFSVIDIEIEKFIAWKTAVPFYQNVSREGGVLWKAA